MLALLANTRSHVDYFIVEVARKLFTFRTWKLYTLFSCGIYQRMYCTKEQSQIVNVVGLRCMLGVMPSSICILNFQMLFYYIALSCAQTKFSCSNHDLWVSKKLFTVYDQMTSFKIKTKVRSIIINQFVVCEIDVLNNSTGLIQSLLRQCIKMSQILK